VEVQRDAGPGGEAADALAAYKAQPGMASSKDEDIEHSLNDFFQGLRQERLGKSGSATCPR
jgi:hypothetical protein